MFKTNLFKKPLLLLVPCRLMQIKRVELYNKCFSILGLQQTADQNTVRKAYIELVKKVHPDSGHPEASSEKFQEIDEAFKVLQEKFSKNRRGIFDDEEEKVFDIRHTAPQHRQYLNFDGVGIGTPFQRQKQHQQVRAMKAQQSVYNHRVEKAQAGDKTLMKKGNFYKSHAIKTKYGIDRVVEDLIQEAMSKGDFDNLSCNGKPLTSAQSQNPYLDFTTHKINKIMLDNGFTPEWISLQRDIRDSVKQLKSNLTKKRSYFGDPPLNQNDEYKWLLTIESFQTDVNRINKNIDKYNLIVPILTNQLFRIRLEKLARDIMNDPNIPRNQKPEETKSTSTNTVQTKKHDLFSFFGSIF